jgi:hypothetical protein
VDVPVLVRHEHVIALPGETIAPVEVLDMAVDPPHMPAAVVAPGASAGMKADVYLVHFTFKTRPSPTRSGVTFSKTQMLSLPGCLENNSPFFVGKILASWSRVFKPQRHSAPLIHLLRPC